MRFRLDLALFPLGDGLHFSTIENLVEPDDPNERDRYPGGWDADGDRLREHRSIGWLGARIRRRDSRVFSDDAGVQLTRFNNFCDRRGGFDWAVPRRPDRLS